jgi:hypothetical protein
MKFFKLIFNIIFVLLVFESNGQDCINPNDGSIEFTDSGTAQIMWTSIPQAEEYQVQYKVSNILSTWEDKFTTSTVVVIDGLIDGIDGEYRVRSKCSNEWQEWEEPTEFTAPVTCSEMNETIIFNGDGTSATVSWDPIPSATHYRFDYRKIGDPDWISYTIFTINNNSTSIILNNLIPETDYEYKTAVKCDNSPWIHTLEYFTTPSPTSITNCGVVFNTCQEELLDYLQTNIGSCKQWDGCTYDDLIYRSGRVGIMTNEMASGFNLAVKGGIITDYINVQLCEDGGWCDYVFEPEYDLKPLEEVEKHIAEKGHLHNTPSSKDIAEAGGVELKETKLNQQEKIEEIFLHLISLNDRVEHLRNEVKKLNLENRTLQNK